MVVPDDVTTNVYGDNPRPSKLSSLLAFLSSRHSIRHHPTIRIKFLVIL